MPRIYCLAYASSLPGMPERMFSRRIYAMGQPHPDFDPVNGHVPYIRSDSHALEAATQRSRDVNYNNQGGPRVYVRRLDRLMPNYTPPQDVVAGE